MSMPSPSELTYFLEVAQTLNMSRAAERLGITQPALTLAVKRLEESLGQAVLLRTKTGVRLTRTGERLVMQARILLNEWDKIRSEVTKDKSEIRGTYTIGCHASVALYTLSHFIPELLKSHPGLDVRLEHDLSRRVTDSVLGFKTDFGIVVNPVQHPDLVLRHLLDDEVSLWVSPRGYQKDVLIYDSNLHQCQVILRQLGKRKISFIRTITSGNLEVVTDLVGAGAGVGIIPGRVVAASKHRLALFDPNLPSFQDKIYLAYRADIQKTQAAKIIIQKISNILSS